MPRTKKPRHCGCAFEGRAYKPSGKPMGELQRVHIGIDELETLRLCDLQGLSQEQAGQLMGVSRGTVQRILSSARKKTAEALTGCKALILEDSICKNIKEDS